MADGKVVIDTALNNKGLTRGVSGLKSVLGDIGKAVGVAFGVAALINFSKKAVELGSNVAEVQNVVDVAFGEMAYKIEEFANTSIQSFGMSQLAAKKTASTYMAMARGMGVNEQAASDMAIGLTGLTGDIASFYNVSQELADVKLKSVFTGETESLKDIGVVMTQTNLKAYALSQGITKNIESMSQGELVSLRYGFVMDQLALAQGDFARTSDSWANQTRILSMQWQEFMSVIGRALVTVLAPMVKVLNTIVAALINMANTFNSVVSGLFGGANTQIQQTQASAEGVGSAIGESADNQNALTDATKKTGKEQKKILAGFDELNQISNPASSGGAGSGGSSPAVGGTLPTTTTVTTDMAGSEQVLAFFDELRKAIQPTADALGRLWEQLKIVGGFTGDALKDFYETFLKPVGAWVMGEGIPRFVDAISKGLALVDWGKINDSLHGLWTALAPFAENVGEGLLWLWDNVLVPFGTWAMNEVVPRFLDAVGLGVEGVNGIIETAKPALQWLWDNFLQPIATWTGGVILDVLDGLNGILEIIVGLITGDFDLAMKGAHDVVESLKNIFESLRDAALSVWEKIKEVWDVVATWFNDNIVKPIADFFSGLWNDITSWAQGAWDGIVGVFTNAGKWFEDNIITPLSNGFKGFFNGLIGFVEGFVNFFIRGINTIVDGINSLSFDLPDFLGGGHVGFDIPRVPELKLPRLATGAVIPPNREFLAVLGDQKSGTNIEAPLSTIEAAVERAMERMGGGTQEITVRFEGTMGQLVRVMKPYLDAEDKRRGVRLVKGGAY